MDNAPPDHQPKVSEFLESYKKKLTTRYVVPAMLVTASLWYVAWIDLNESNWHIFAAFGVGLVTLNIIFSKLSFKLRLGSKEVDNRSEIVDVVRWLANFVCDAIVMSIFVPAPIGHLGIWIMLITAALADTSRRSFQMIVSIAGVAAATYTLVTLFPDLSGWEMAFGISVIVAHTAILNSSEALWISEIQKRNLAEKRERMALRREANLYLQSEKIKHDAMLGEKVRFISHEINNLMFVLEAARTGNFDDRKQKIFMRAFDKLRGITNLVLSDLKGAENLHEMQVGRLMEDVQLILGKRFALDGLILETKADDAALNMRFTERKGSTFYILNNLLKNAREACKASDSSNTITVEVTCEDNRFLRFAVRDEGPGMSEEQIARILQYDEEIVEETYESTKESGHGIGMRFVKSECQKNGFDFDISSKPGEGTTATLFIDTKAVQSSGPPNSMTA